MRIDEFDFYLPSDRIARFPAKKREDSKLLVVNRRDSSLTQGLFSDLPHLLKKEDFLVINNSAVIPAKLFGLINSKMIELTIVKILDKNQAEVLAKPAKYLINGRQIKFGEVFMGRVIRSLDEGRRWIEFSTDIDNVLKGGFAPLPPYIKRKRKEAEKHKEFDLERYQTVYSENGNSIAAPTAGLHFSKELLKRINKNNPILKIRLDVGEATFQKIKKENIREHQMGEENIFLKKETIRKVEDLKNKKHNLIAVGTTSVRTLESYARLKIKREYFRSQLFIYPGFEFRMVDKLITNFHLPKSSLFILVCAFGGVKLMQKAYDFAKSNNFKFYSYGDVMLII